MHGCPCSPIRNVRQANPLGACSSIPTRISETMARLVSTRPKTPVEVPRRSGDDASTLTAMLERDAPLSRTNRIGRPSTCPSIDRTAQSRSSGSGPMFNGAHTARTYGLLGTDKRRHTHPASRSATRATHRRAVPSGVLRGRRAISTTGVRPPGRSLCGLRSPGDCRRGPGAPTASRPQAQQRHPDGRVSHCEQPTTAAESLGSRYRDGTHRDHRPQHVARQGASGQPGLNVHCIGQVHPEPPRRREEPQEDPSSANDGLVRSPPASSR